MVNLRRWYVYIASAITLQSLTWATIALLRNLIIPALEVDETELAYQIAVIIVGLPIFLVHWVWAQRMANRDPEERASLPRRLYLYAMLGAYLGPLTASAFYLARSILYMVFRVTQKDYNSGLTSPLDQALYSLISALVLALLFACIWRVKAKDDQDAPESDASAIIRQVYFYLFCAVGLIISTLGVVNLLRWLMATLAPAGTKIGMGETFLSTEIARLAAGLLLWVIFWRRAQKQFYGPEERDRESVVRKIYLYLLVFVAVITVVTTAAIILSDIISRLLNVPPSDGDIQLALSIIIGVGTVWAYHAFVLSGDAKVAEGARQQALVRRIYLYLMMGVGLAAVLVGLGGILSVLIRSLAGRGLIIELREQLAWFTASLVAGLPVWLVHWRQVQIAASQEGSVGLEERRSFMRSFYLYFYILVATVTVLSGAVYIVSQLVELVIGARSSKGLITDIGQAVAYVLIAVAVWVYHGAILRQDRRLLKRIEEETLKEMRVVVVDVGVGEFGLALVGELQGKLPGLKIDKLVLSTPATEAVESVEILSNAEVIIGPWTMAVGGWADGIVNASVADAVVSSPARKLLIPVREDGWDWMGVERWNTDAIVKEVIGAVSQIAAGEEPRPARRLGAVAIAVIVLISLCLLTQISFLLLSFF